MGNKLRVYFTFKAQYLKTAMEYKLNFWMMVIAGVVMRTLMLGVAYVLFRNVSTIAGFQEGEVYLIIAFMTISEGLCELLFDGIWFIPGLVANGELDVMLVRPISPLYQILSYEIGLQGVGVLAMGLISLVLAINSLGWLSPGRVLLCLLFIVCGMVLRMSTYLISNCYVFWLDPGSGSRSNLPFMINSIGEYARYPVNVYPAWMQVVLLFVIPFGFIGYVPVLLLRGEQVFLFGTLLAVMTTGYFLLARRVFYKGIGRYESMGM